VLIFYEFTFWSALKQINKD